MILDAYMMFTAAAGDSPTASGVSANQIDLHNYQSGVSPPTGGIPVLANGQGVRDLGIGDAPALKILALVTAGFTTGTSLQVSLQGAPDNGSNAPASFVTWYSSPVYTVTGPALLGAGARLLDMDLPRPPQGQPIPRYLQLAYTIVGATNGTLKAFIVLDRFDQVYNAANNGIIGGYVPGVVVPN